MVSVPCLILGFLVCFSSGTPLPTFLTNLGANLGITQCSARASYPNVIPPPTFDARVQWPQCIGQVGNQGSCGCCWAYSAAQAYSDRLCIASNTTVSRCVSPQDLVNCDNDCKGTLLSQSCNQGCNGGYCDLAWSYLRDTGTVGQTCVPFASSKGACATSCATNETFVRKYKVSDCYQVGPGSSDLTTTGANAQKVISTEGTIQAAFTVYNDFFNYKSGVYVYDGTSAAAGGHAVRMIGWGTEGGVPYWLCLNQWTTGWGDAGSFKIRRGTNECSIEDNLIAGTVVWSGLSDKEYCTAASTPAASSSHNIGHRTKIF